MTTPTSRTRTMRPYQWLALAIGVLYLLIGLLGFVVTGFEGWTEHDHDQTLVGFAVNPLHNVVHVVIGLAGIALARTPGGARTFGWLLVVAYGAVLVYGLVIDLDSDANILNLNAADNVLHALSVVAGLAIALWPDRRGVESGYAGRSATDRRP